MSIEQAILDTLERDHPQTLRGLFYQLVSNGVLPKTEAAYKSITGRLCTRLRRQNRLPYQWLADSTRWMRKPRTYSSMASMLAITARTYRRALWADQDAYVEIWCEKDALAGVLYEETETWDVPLMVTRGYPSLSFLYEAAEQIRDQHKPTFLYYFGDYDPAGVDIPRRVEHDLRDMAGPHTSLHFSRVAVTPDQIVSLRLPTRPTKRTDARGRAFGARSVEVDALPAQVLRQMVHDCIEPHVDRHALSVTKTAEDSEREILTKFAKRQAASR